MDLKFFCCPKCGNVFTFLNCVEEPISCCCQSAQELVPNSSGADPEVHVPVICQPRRDVVLVKVGRRPHPMVREHYIEWICLQTTRGSQIRPLAPGGVPQASFRLCPGDTVVAAYAFCNLHGLWMASCGSNRS